MEKEPKRATAEDILGGAAKTEPEQIYETTNPDGTVNVAHTKKEAIRKALEAKE